MNFDDFGDDSDDADDIDMKELEHQANQNNNQYQNEVYNQDVINDQIEDYDSDGENADQIAAIEKQIKEEQRKKNAGKVPGLAIGGLSSAGYGANAAGQAFGVPKVQMHDPNKGKVPALNMGMQIPGLQDLQKDMQEQVSGRQSSKRQEIGRLNIGIAQALQQQQLQKNEQTIQKVKGGVTQEVQDIDDDQPSQKKGPGLGGLNLGALNKNKGAGAAPMNPGGGGFLQLGMAISNKNVDDGPTPPVARRGADLD